MIISQKNDYVAENISMDSVIDDIIKRHSISKVEINNLTLECMTALTASNAKSYELSSKSKLKYIVDSFNGKNKKLISDMNISLATSQEAAQLTLQKLAESNLMSFELISAVNFKLNNAIKYVNNEVKDIYTTMISFFKTSQNSIWEINTRLDKIEKNLDLLNWLSSLEYRIYKGQEYSELDLTQKILVITRDFYNIIGNDVKPSDLLSLKSSLKSLNVNPNEEVLLFDFLNEVSNDANLNELIDGHKIINNANHLPIASYLSNLSSFQTDKRYIIDQMIDEFNSHQISQSPEQIMRNLSRRYVNDYLQYDLMSNVKVFDLILLILLHLEQTNQAIVENVEFYDEESHEEISSECENNVPSLLDVWDIINVNTVFTETEKYYYFYENEDLYRVDKSSNSKEHVYSIQKHSLSGIGIVRNFSDNWHITILRDDYIVYCKDIDGRNTRYELCLYSVEQQIETVIYTSNRKFSFGVDNESNLVYYFVGHDYEFDKNKQINSGLFKYDVLKNVHVQVALVKNRLEDSLPFFQSEDFAREQFDLGYDFFLRESPVVYDGYICVNKGRILIEPKYPSMQKWCVLIKGSEYKFYTLPESLSIDEKDNHGFRILGLHSNYDLKIEFNWETEIYEIDFSAFKRSSYQTGFPIAEKDDQSAFQFIISDEGISKCRFNSNNATLTYPMKLSVFWDEFGFEADYDVFKRAFPNNAETIILGKFRELSKFGQYIYTRNRMDNDKVYRYNLDDLDDIRIINT